MVASVFTIRGETRVTTFLPDTAGFFASGISSGSSSIRAASVVVSRTIAGAWLALVLVPVGVLTPGRRGCGAGTAGRLVAGNSSSSPSSTTELVVVTFVEKKIGKKLELA